MTICQRCKRPIKWFVDWHGKPVACEPEGVTGYTQRRRQVLVYPKHECPSTEDGDGDQSKLPDAIREMGRDCQRRRLHGHIMTNSNSQGAIMNVAVKESHGPEQVIERYARPGGQAMVLVRTPRGSVGAGS